MMHHIPQGPIALFPVVVITAATVLSVLTITTCNLVEYRNPNEYAGEGYGANNTLRTAGLFCGDGYESNVFGSVWSSAVVNASRFFAIGAAVCGGCTTVGLYPICCQRYNRFARIMMCCICLCCFPSQLLALLMLQSDFCWDLSGLSNHCSLDWGGVVCIVAAIGWLLGAISFMILPHHAVERPPKQPKPPNATATITSNDPEAGTTTVTETINPDGTKETKKVTINADGTKTIEIIKEAAVGKNDYDNIPVATNVVPVPLPASTVPSVAKVAEP